MNSRRLLILSLLSLVALAVTIPVGFLFRAGSRTHSLASVSNPQDSALTQTRVAAAYGKLPLTFEQNQGQTDSRVKFLARGGGYTVFLTEDQSATLRLSAPAKDGLSPRERLLARFSKRNAIAETPAPDAVVRVALVGSNAHAPVEGSELQSGKSNYFIGNKPESWHRNVPHFARVKYREVYPGIDLVYYGNQGLLESDYVLAPGARPEQIALRIDGARSAEVDSQGDLRLATSTGDVVLQKPRTYQEIAGERREIAANYVQRGAQLFGLEVAPYDTQAPLVIDPSMIYSTFLGGNAADAALGIAVDSTGNAYVTGGTTSLNFPTTSGAFQTTFPVTSPPPNTSVTFITKLNPAGTALVYSTFLGGSTSGTSDTGAGIAVDASGDAFVTGTTGASDFPLSTAPNTPIEVTDKNNSGTSFLTKLDPTGATLLYSTYLSGSSSEAGLGITLDSNGIAYVTGGTTSGDFPTTSNRLVSAASTCGGGGTNLAGGFISKIDTTKSGLPGLLYSTFLGGSGGFDTATSIAVDANAKVYVTGFASSCDFPLVNAFQTTLKSATTDGFVSAIDTSLATPALLYSTYLGGSGTSGKNGSGDTGQGIAADANQNVYVTGKTGSTDFPVTSGSFQQTNKSAFPVTAYVARLDTTKSGASSLVYSTYLGGSGLDEGLSIAVDSTQNAYIAGTTSSGNFPFTTGAPQTTIGGIQNSFVTVMNPAGTSVLFSTFWGGGNLDIGFGLAIDNSSPHNIFIAGSTTSITTFPTSTPAFQKTASGSKKAFVAKFSGGAAAGTVTVSTNSLNFGTQIVNTASAPQTVTLNNGSASAITISSIAYTGTNSADFTTGTGSTCGTSLAAGANCNINVVFTPAGTGARAGTLVITDTVDSGSPHNVTLSGTGTASGTPDFTVSAAPTSGSVASGSSANFTITITSLTGFNSTVTPMCTQLPPASSCVFSPTTATPAANASTTISATINTTKFQKASLPFSLRIPPGFPSWPVGIAGIVLVGLAIWMATRPATRKLAFGLGLLAVLTLTSCSGPLATGTPPSPTPYIIKVTLSSGALSHPLTFSLTVN